MAGSRRAYIKIEYAGQDITEALSNSVTILQYVDKASGSADELTITCHDREGHWHNDWYPKIAYAPPQPPEPPYDYTEMAQALQNGTTAANLQRLIDESDLTPEQGRTLQRVTPTATWRDFTSRNPQYRGFEGKLLLIQDIKRGIIR
ncbi:MAG: hypothetical protein FWB95_02535 [Treponema sp.]|nr:hypothetical protein [Treponema sp.]